MRSRRLAPLLAVGGLLVLALTATLGPALAAGPSSGAVDDGPAATLVGVQGVGSYAADGYVARLNGTETAWRHADASTYHDVTRLSDGRVLAAFMRRGASDCGDYEAPCARTGYQVLDPEADGGPAVVESWSFPVRSHTNSEVHDVEPLPGGGYVLADMDRERVVVVEDGRVTWQWNASSRYDPPADPTRADWLHVNDVDRIGDGRFLVSVRNANQLVVVERGRGVVEVVNGDAGDTSGDPAVLRRQHNPQWLGDGAVLVADSENHRVVELHRTADGDWTPAWTLRAAGDSRFDWPRDADRLPNGNTLITDTRNARLVEVDESGAVVWRARFDYRTLPYEADRLPPGERVGAPRYGTDADAGTPADAEPATPGGAAPAPGAVRDWPVLTPGLRLLSAAVRLPRWFAEPHLLATLLGAFLTLGGAVLGARTWLAERP